MLFTHNDVSEGYYVGNINLTVAVEVGIFHYEIARRIPHHIVRYSHHVRDIHECVAVNVALRNLGVVGKVIGYTEEIFPHESGLICVLAPNGHMKGTSSLVNAAEC